MDTIGVLQIINIIYTKIIIRRVGFGVDGVFIIYAGMIYCIQHPFNIYNFYHLR